MTRKTIDIKARENPKSLALALKAYFLDMSGYLLNRDCPGVNVRELRHEAAENYQQAIKQGRPQAVKNICVACIGDEALGSIARQVRDCPCKDCFLWPVRPWRNLKGRGQYKRA